MDTIFAPITGRGGAVTVFRISGTHVKKCIEHLGVSKELEERKTVVCKLIDPKNKSILDEAMIIYFVSPRSFTGEDVCEINLHSSPYIVTRLMEILSSLKGVRLAEPGEFSKRAFLNNKIDLTQAEGICDLVMSETNAQHKQAMLQLQGNMKNFYDNLRSTTIDIMANLEAYIDFPEDDIPEDVTSIVTKKVKALKKEIAQHLEDGKVGEKIRNGILITILGNPNAGKSSLLNYLAKRDVAIVSDVAGTTRDVLEVSLNLNGLPVVLFDTAGLRNTQNVVEMEGVKRAIRKIEEADLKIAMIDATNLKEQKEIEKMIDDKTIVVVNKTDLPTDAVQLQNYINKLNSISKKDEVIQVSVKTGSGIANLIKIITEKVKKITTQTSDPLITRERHRVALQEAYDALEVFSLDKGIELAGEDLRIAANAIGKITGQIRPDDILDSIFSKFCLGK